MIDFSGYENLAGLKRRKKMAAKKSAVISVQELALALDIFRDIAVSKCTGEFLCAGGMASEADFALRAAREFYGYLAFLESCESRQPNESEFDLGRRVLRGENFKKMARGGAS